MPALGWPKAPQNSFLMRPGKGASLHWYRNIFSHVPSTKVREIAAMLKAIHASEDLAAAREKAIRVIEKLRGLRLTRAAELVEAAIEETLAYYAFPEEQWRRIRTIHSSASCVRSGGARASWARSLNGTSSTSSQRSLSTTFPDQTLLPNSKGRSACAMRMLARKSVYSTLCADSSASETNRRSFWEITTLNCRYPPCDA